MGKFDFVSSKVKNIDTSKRAWVVPRESLEGRKNALFLMVVEVTLDQQTAPVHVFSSQIETYRNIHHTTREHPTDIKMYIYIYIYTCI